MGMTRLKLFIVLVGALVAAGLAAGGIGKRHDVVISFGSICCGTDMGAMTGLEALIEQFEGRHPGRLRVEKRYWGLEGEADYCIGFRGVPWKERHAFLDAARAIVKAADSRTVMKGSGACGGPG